MRAEKFIGRTHKEIAIKGADVDGTVRRVVDGVSTRGISLPAASPVNGGGLFNVPLSAINANALQQRNSVVARDSTGGFSAGISLRTVSPATALVYSTFPLFAINATSLNSPSTVVSRDTSGSFAAGGVQVLNS